MRGVQESEKNAAGQEKKDGIPKRGGDGVRGSGQTLSSFDRRAGQRDRCYRFGSEYHLAP